MDETRAGGDFGTVRVAVLLTWARIALIPLMVLFFWMPLLPEWWSGLLATAVFVVAAVTDWVDGMVARHMGQESRFGAFLDPVADKLLVCVALVLLLLAEQEAYSRWLLGILAMVIIGREICVSALREWMAEIGARVTVKVGTLGKWKTGVQMVAIPMLLFGQDVGAFPTRVVGLAMLTVAAVLTIVSMVSYLRVAWPHLGARD